MRKNIIEVCDAMQVNVLMSFLLVETKVFEKLMILKYPNYIYFLTETVHNYCSKNPI